MSVPFINKKFVLEQPDGSQLEVRGWGNQYAARFETLDGFTVVEDPATGYFEYAIPDDDGLKASGVSAGSIDPKTLGVSPHLRPARPVAATAVRESTLTRGGTRWEQRRAAAREAQRSIGILGAPPLRKTVGSYVGLVLLIDFSDVPQSITQAQVDDFCNKKGYTAFKNNGSVFDYFFDVSGGKLLYTNVIAKYYRAKHPRSYYTDPKVAQPIRARQLIREALTKLKADGFNFAQLTVDDQQCVYAINAFYTGVCPNNWGKGLWPHCHYLASPFKLANGIYAHDYQITDMGNELSIGTFCHENGHMICDFPDLYDYGDESDGVGAFCLMCAGANIDEKNPTDVGAYLKRKAGWGTTTTLAPGKYQAKAGANEFFLHPKNATEYFIIENRLRQGRDAALPSEGLAIWHVDELGDQEYENMTAKLHYECSLEQADGKFEFEKNLEPYGDAGDLFSAATKTSFSATSKPASNWWDGSPSALKIDKIGPAGASVDFEVP